MTRTSWYTAVQAAGMIARWQDLGNETTELTLDALEALSRRKDLAVLKVAERVPDDAILRCSVAGGYRWKTKPPTLVVAESMSRRRQQFTVLHELGHHIQKNDLALGEKIMGHPDPEGFEDSSCDAFASKILLPDDLIADFIDPKGPTAASAVDIFHASNASRAAVAVRLAQLLQGPGAVAVLDDAARVKFAASHGDFYPPARGSDQGMNPLVKAAFEASRDHITTRDNARILYKGGHSSIELYGQAAWAETLLFVVMAESAASWKAFSPPRVDTAQFRSVAFAECEVCGEQFKATFTCNTCHQPKCSSGHCGCTVAKEIVCEGCFLQKHASQFDFGSKICRECAA